MSDGLKKDSDNSRKDDIMEKSPALTKQDSMTILSEVCYKKVLKVVLSCRQLDYNTSDSLLAIQILRRCIFYGKKQIFIMGTIFKGHY